MQLKVEKSPSNFIRDCVQGYALLDDIDDYVDQWHDGGTGLALHDYLGMSKQEYDAWVLDDEMLAYVVKARREQVPFNVIIQQDYSYALAARSQGSQQLTHLMQWLQQEGLL